MKKTLSKQGKVSLNEKSLFLGEVLLVSLPWLSDKESDWLLPDILMKFYHSQG